MNVSNRDNARDLLETADACTDDVPGEGYSATKALAGIGYALLEVADAIRDRTAAQVQLADVEAALMRVATAPDRDQAAPAEHVAGHA